MKTLLTILLFTALSLHAFAQSTFTEKTLTDMRQRMLSTNWEKFSKEEVSPDFVMQGNAGKPCDMTCMEALNNSSTIVAWPMEQIKIRQVGNVAIVTGITHHSGVNKKTNVRWTANERFTETYEYKNGKWLWQTAQYTSIQAPVENVEATIRALDALETAAFIKQDYAALDTLWATDMKVNGPRNTISLSAAQTGELLKKGLIKHFSTERNIEQIFIKGDNMVVVMGSEVVKNTATEPAYTRRFTNFWMKQGNSWKLTFRHANIIGDPQLATTGQKEQINDSKKIAQRYFEEVINQQKLENMDELFDANYLYLDLVNFTEEKGIENLKKVVLPNFFKAFPDAHYQVESIITEGDKVSARIIATATHKGDFAGIPATNNKVKVSIIYLFTIKKNKISDCQRLVDFQSFFKQISAK